MIYISEKELSQVTIDWSQNIEVIEQAVKCLASKDYTQPIKPYLRYRNLKNRIIAMPAFLGGEFNISGIKWISSFPDNIKKGIPRAHCVVILNNADTGEPVAILNTASISAIRTASVSGYVLREYLKNRSPDNLTIGIVGFGPIGQYHLRMCSSLVNDKDAKILLFDLNDVNETRIPENCKDKVVVVDSWEKAYEESDIFITCTVSPETYIDKKPKAGSLHLNVSLRDYKVSAYDWFKDAVIVDDWDEVCRENTDVERFHLEKGLQKEQVGTICNLLDPEWINLYGAEQAIMFSPMGMAIFDIAMAQYYADRMKKENRGHIF